MQLMPYLIGSLKILLVILFAVTLLTYMFHALKGFGKKATVGVTAGDAEKLTARKEKMVEKTRHTRTSTPNNSRYYEKKMKSSSSGYSSRERQERRYRKVMSSNRLTVINETL